MAETTLTKKLLIKPGHQLLLINAPEGYMDTLGPLPEGVEVKASPNLADTDPRGLCDVVQLFVREKAEVGRDAPAAMAAVKSTGVSWVCWPKRGAAVPTDLDRDSLIGLMMAQGWGPATAISIDATWSALRFRPEGEINKGAGSALHKKS